MREIWTSATVGGFVIADGRCFSNCSFCDSPGFVYPKVECPHGKTYWLEGGGLRAIGALEAVATGNATRKMVTGIRLQSDDGGIRITMPCGHTEEISRTTAKAIVRALKSYQNFVRKQQAAVA